MDDPWGPVVDEMKEYLIINGLYDEYANTLNAFNLTATVVSLDRIQQMYRGTIKKEKASERLNQFRNVYDKKAKIDNSNMMNKAKIFEWSILCNMYRPVFFFSAIKKIMK